MTEFTRADRVSGLIQKTLSEILRKTIKDPRLELTTITTVKMSRDLRIARIYYTIPSGKKDIKRVEEGFKSSSGFIKRKLAGKLGLRYMPDLKYFYDDSFDYGAHIEDVLKSIKTNDG